MKAKFTPLLVGFMALLFMGLKAKAQEPEPATDTTSVNMALMAPAPLAATNPRNAIKSGNWNDATIWSPVGVPNSSDDVTINTGITVTVNVAGGTIASLTVTGTLNVNNSLTIANNGSITVNSGGTINMNNDITLGNNSTITIDGSVVFNSTAVIKGGGGNGANLSVNKGASITTANTTGFNNTGTDPIGGSFNIANKGTKYYDPAANYTYNGTAAQSTGTGLPATITGNLTILNPAGVTLTNGSGITVNSPGILTVDGLLKPTAAQLIAGTGTLTGNGTVEVSRTAATPDFSSQYTISAANRNLSNLTVNYNGTGAQTVSAITYGNLTISTTNNRTVTMASSGTIGISGAFSPSSTNTNYTVAGSTVDFNGSGTQTIPANFSFNNLSTSNGGIKTAGSPVTVLGNLSIGNNTTLSAGAVLNVAGNFSNVGNFTHNNGSVNFNGAAQTVSGNTAFYNLNLSGTGNKDFGNSEVTIANSFTANGGSMVGGSSTFIFTGNNGSITGANAKNFNKLQINNGANIAVSGGNLTINNSFTNNGIFNQSAGSNTFFSNNQTLAGSGSTTFGSLTVQGSTTLDAGTHNFTINGGSLSASSGGTFNGGTATVAFTGVSSIGNGTGTINFNNLTIGSGTLSNSINKNFNLSGNWTNNGIYTAGTETITLNGAAQTIGGTNGTTFSNLTLAGTADKTLASDISVSTALSLSDKKINTGTYILTADNITRTTGYIVGNLRKSFSSGNKGRSFDIGTSLYTPVAINFNTVTNSGFLTARTTDADHPNIGTSSIDPSQTVNRYWTVTKDNALAFNNYAITLNYNISENDDIIHAPAYVLGKFDGGAWTYPTVSASPTSTSLTATGLTNFSDFQVGREKNIAPVLTQIGDKTVDEKTPLTFTATATDENLPANTLKFSLEGTVPTGAAIDATTGVFSWTPTEAQGPGVYTFKVRVTDDGHPPMYDEEEITITVNEVNIAPVLAQIGNQTVDEKTPLTFTATATDENLPANTLKFSLEGTVPAGAAIDATTGVFSWTPTEAQGPGVYTFKVRVTDNGNPPLYDEQDITVTVNEVNIAPVLAQIGNQNVDEKTPLTFTATATDENLPANTLTFSLQGTVPAGAAIDASTGVFSWTPTEAQGPGVYTFKVRVTDNGNPPLYDEEEITVTVNEVNIAPVLAQIGNQTVDEKTPLTFTATATDENLPANTLTFSLQGTVPSGAAIDATTGVFSWTPTEAQGPGVYTFKVRVTDDGHPPLYDEEEITVTVNEVNIAPVLAQIGDKSVDEKTLLTFTASATDENLPPNNLAFSLQGTVPAGAAIDAQTGVFSWTPTEAQGPGVYTFKVRVIDDGHPPMYDEEEITVTVNEVNIAPVLAQIGNQTVDEKKLLTFTATATDENLPANTLKFSLEGTVPSGAAIDAATGVFSWTPTEAQGPGVYTFKVRVTDDGHPPMYDEEEITITVNEVNIAPVLAQIGNQTVDEKTLLTFTATATDENLPANTLTFSLQGTVPSGAAINPATGVFAWTPTEAQGPGVYTFKVRVTDDGHPPMYDEEEITVTVNEVNIAPVLTQIGDKTVDEKTLLTFTATANDENLPANTLTFSLQGTVPSGAAIDATTGVFFWTPTEAQGPGVYTFKVRVTDDGHPPMHDEEEITITVNEVNIAPLLTQIGDKTVDEKKLLTFTATATDENLPANTLTFSLEGAVPAGAAIDATTGVFSWTPTEAQGPGVYTFKVRVTDDGHPPMYDEEEITITVNEVNIAPVLSNVPPSATLTQLAAYSFNANATDEDLPVQTLTFSLVGAPSGANINSSTGAFTWTPSAENIPGNYTFLVRVSDGIANTDQSITLTVLDGIAPTVITKNITAQLDATGHATIHHSHINNGSKDNHTPDPDLIFSLDKTEFDCGNVGDNTVTLTVWDAAGNTASKTAKVTILKEAPIAKAKDISIVLLPDGTATISPENINDNSSDVCGAISMSLSQTEFGYSHINKENKVTLTVTDQYGNSSSAMAKVIVTKNPPVLAIIDPRFIEEEILLSFKASANDEYSISNLTFSLANAPEEASIDPISGEFTWKPAKGKAVGGVNTVYTFTVKVTDGFGMSASQLVYVTVTPKIVVCNIAAPKISVSRSDKTFTGLDENTITLGYGAQKLTFNASNGSSSTDFSWSPAIAELKNPNSANPEFAPTKPGVYNFTVTIKDRVSGCQASNSITITVLDVICDDKSKKVSVSHKDGKSNSVLCISVNAVDAHLAHGDKLVGAGPVNAGSAKNTYYTPESQEVLKANLSVLEPASTQLKAYPNPFAKQSTVRFTVPNDEQKVTLEVYNLSGRKVRHLYEGRAQAHQPYSFQLDGSNLAPGVYLIRLLTSKGVETFRVIMTE